jgi:hypothetical protein
MTCIYNWLKRRAWDVDVDEEQVNSLKLTPGFTLYGKAPGWDAHGIYQFFSHTFLYCIAFIVQLILFPYRYFFNFYQFSEEDVFDYIHETALILLVEVLKDTNTSTFKLKRKFHQLTKVNGFTPENIEFTFDIQTKKIVSINDELRNCSNEIFITCLFHILTYQVHPTIHVAAEKSAIEIQSKRINLLSASVHFVSSLHEGLLFNYFSPLGKSVLRYTDYNDVPTLYGIWTDMSKQPIHVLQHEKEIFPFYKFLVQSRSILFHQLSKNLVRNINYEYLFLNCIVHSLDHMNSFKILSKSSRMSENGSPSLYYILNMYFYTHIWLPYHENMFNSNHLSKCQDVFFKELYLELKKIDVQDNYISEIVVSTCF